jgi:hypothetical protein
MFNSIHTKYQYPPHILSSTPFLVFQQSTPSFTETEPESSLITYIILVSGLTAIPVKESPIEISLFISFVHSSVIEIDPDFLSVMNIVSVLGLTAIPTGDPPIGISSPIESSTSLRQ